MGYAPGSLLARVLLRPAALALTSILVTLLAANQQSRWPYAVVAGASLIGLWEGYGGVLQMLRGPRVRRAPGRQIEVCAIWLVNTLACLSLLNMATQLSYPDTFEWRGKPASALDVVYLTILTFASSGYGDVLPATPAGKILSTLTSFAGLGYATILCTAVWQHFSGDKSDG